MNAIKRISLIVVAVLVLACSVPLSSLAVDPVSAATMANALAQAITAYGASQGVSMTFDVANTDGIGEGVHELWDQYQADMANSSVTVSDYQNLAASAFPTLWIKIGEKIGVNLDAASVGEIDGFWNWLLSGPAEMTKVDNQYYEWTLNQDNSVSPITVYSYTDLMLNGNYLNTLPITARYGNKWETVSSSNPNVYAIVVSEPDGQWYQVKLFTLTNTSSFSFTREWSNGSVVTSNTQTPSELTGYYYAASTTLDQYYIPVGVKLSTYTGGNIASYLGNYQDQASEYESINTDLSVQPYVGDAVPQDVYIPDNTDVNYEPIPAAIPTDISWDDALFGDGTGILTDAQSEAITQTVDQTIVDNPAKTIELAESTPPAPSPSEVYIPFLPVTLPSFQFSLSGIWHYVTAWVASLGAWFSLVFTTWSYLPYAISVPVYATAVIVIVLGVYKRFFM